MEKIVKNFTNFELDNNLFDKKISSLKFWSYVRFSIFWSYYLGDHSDEIHIQKVSLYLKYMKGFFQSFANFYRIWNKNYDFIFINTSRRTHKLDNRDVDIYTYPIIKYLNDKYNILLLDISKFSKSDDYPCDFIPMRFSQVFFRIFRFFYRFNKKEKIYLNALENNLNELFKMQVNASRVIRSEIIRHKIEFKLYKIIFQILSPKILFYTNNGVMAGIIEAANELGIKTVELQHGGISHLHIAYNSEYFLPKTTPNFVFSFGEYWHDAIKFGSKKLSIGFPYMELTEKSLPQNISRDKKSILVISNGKLGRLALVDITKEILSSCKTYKVYYKLKPSEYNNWKEIYPKSFQNKSNLFIIDNNSKPLNYFYKKAAYLIGSGSTCIYEGLANDMIVFAIKSLYYSDAKKLIDSNTIFLASNANEILTKIGDKDVPVGQVKKDYLFKAQTHENVLQNVQELLLK